VILADNGLLELIDAPVVLDGERTALDAQLGFF